EQPLNTRPVRSNRLLDFADSPIARDPISGALQRSEIILGSRDEKWLVSSGYGASPLAALRVTAETASLKPNLKGPVARTKFPCYRDLGRHRTSAGVKAMGH